LRRVAARRPDLVVMPTKGERPDVIGTNPGALLNPTAGGVDLLVRGLDRAGVRRRPEDQARDARQILVEPAEVSEIPLADDLGAVVLNPLVPLRTCFHPSFPFSLTGFSDWLLKLCQGAFQFRPFFSLCGGEAGHASHAQTRNNSDTLHSATAGRASHQSRERLGM
jgi:hypothetical protein